MYQQPAYCLAFRILGNEEARDAVQECVIRIWQKIGSFDSAREFIPWMYRILTNTATDQLRTMARHATIPLEQVAGRLTGLFQHERDTEHIQPDSVKQLIYLGFFKYSKRKNL